MTSKSEITLAELCSIKYGCYYLTQRLQCKASGSWLETEKSKKLVRDSTIVKLLGINLEIDAVVVQWGGNGPFLWFAIQAILDGLLRPVPEDYEVISCPMASVSRSIWRPVLRKAQE